MINYHRRQIREFFGFREALRGDADEMTEWLCRQVLAQDQNIEHLKELVYARFGSYAWSHPTPSPSCA